MATPDLQRYLAAADDWPGWFHHTDRQLFQLADSVQQRHGPEGDLLEIGVFLGKSAALLGLLRHGAQRLVACDVFDSVPYPDEATVRESREFFQGLSRSEFERRYLSVHTELPEIIEDLSSTLLDHGLSRTFRFAHVDAGHTYAAVRDDARLVRELLVPGGLAVFDDWRTGHVPGVHAAVWGAVHQDGLIPLVLTDAKFYGTFAPLSPTAVAFRDAVSDAPDLPTELHDIAGHLVVRLTRCAVTDPARA